MFATYIYTYNISICMTNYSQCDTFKTEYLLTSTALQQQSKKQTLQEK